MVISMKLHSTREEIDQVRKRIEHFGYKVHSIEGEERVVIGVVGVGDVTACLESVEAMPQVESAVRISAPYKFVSREFRRGKTQIRIDGVEIGGDEFVVMAGPCSVESEEQIMSAAETVARAGAKMLRGGAFKPRTSPYDFQGLEEEGLKLLAKARTATGLGIVTEVMSDSDVDLVAQGSGPVLAAHPAQTRPQLHGKGVADVSRVYRGAWESQRDSVRARHPHV
jgi:3-deoxy-7-phosphoheptulonate synthase